MTQTKEAISLLDDVRNELDITWADEAGDRKLLGIIARGMAYIRGRCGDRCDFAHEGDARGLLMTYVMYARAGALDDFIRNYMSDIIALQLDMEVERHVEHEENRKLWRRHTDCMPMPEPHYNGDKRHAPVWEKNGRRDALLQSEGCFQRFVQTGSCPLLRHGMSDGYCPDRGRPVQDFPGPGEAGHVPAMSISGTGEDCHKKQKERDGWKF